MRFQLMLCLQRERKTRMFHSSRSEAKSLSGGGRWRLLVVCLLVILAYGCLIPASTAHAMSSDTTVATINGLLRYQTIDGFGFSEAFGRANSMYNAPPALRQQMIDLLFNPVTGAGFTILRNIISSDANSIEPDSPGSPTAPPQYVWDGYDTGQVWLSQQAQFYGAQIYADAWSAPGFMKTNGDQANGGTLCGVPGATCSSGDWRQAYANYLAQYIKDYASEGVRIAGVGFVNEPNLTTSYSSMVINPEQAVDFIKVLGPTLKADRLSTRIVCCDAEGWDLAPAYTSAIMSDPLARFYVGIISSHGYTEAPTFPLSAGNKHVWQTEWANFDTFDPAWDDGTAAAGFTWAQNIYTGLTSANLSAFLHWWGVNTSDTNSGLIHYDQTANTLTTSKRYYAFVNYSRFIRPGAVRLGASSSNSGLEVTAFRNRDGSLVIVALNTATTATPVSFSLRGLRVAWGSVAVPYVTDANNDTAPQVPIVIKDGGFSTTVGPRALVTYQIVPPERGYGAEE
jgi:glucuronoarabinoxylan endo-1,4-beta-xylanase